MRIFAALMSLGATACFAQPAQTSADASPQPTDTSQPISAAAGPENPVSYDYLKLIWADTVETATTPLQWDQRDWKNFGLISGGLVFSMAVLDKPIRDAAQHGRSHSSDQFFQRVQRFGTKQYGLPVLAGFYTYGLAADDYESKTVALDGLSASLISALVTSSIKGVIGRARPNSGLGPHDFRPGQGDYSFPSGHATGAFTFASVIAAHYDSIWVDGTAYGIAGLVALARVRLDAHWASDVVAGGLIGGLIGHHLVNFNRELRAKHTSLMPTISSDGRQVLLTWEF